MQVDDEFACMTDADLINETRRLESDKRNLDAKLKRMANENKQLDSRIKENTEKLKMSTQLPHMVANVAEILDVEDEDEEGKEGSGFAIKKTELQKKMKKALVVKTSGRGTYYLPVLGLLEPEDIKPNELVAVNKESFVVYEKLPPEYDSRVKAMEVDEKPAENYGDVGGLDKQLQELQEAVVLPMTHKEKFQKLGIRPPKGVLMFGPPGTGKTLMARACATETNATFMKLAGPELV